MAGKESARQQLLPGTCLYRSGYFRLPNLALATMPP